MGDQNRDVTPDSPPTRDGGSAGDVGATGEQPTAADVVPADTETPPEPDPEVAADQIGGVTQAEDEGA